MIVQPTSDSVALLTFTPEQAASLSAILHNAVRLLKAEHQIYKDHIFLGYIAEHLLNTAQEHCDEVEAYVRAHRPCCPPDDDLSNEEDFDGEQA